MLEVDAAGQGIEVDRLEDWLLLDLVEEESWAAKRSARKKLRLGLRFVDNNRVEGDHCCDQHCPTDDNGECRLTSAGWDDDLDLALEGHVDTLGGEGSPLIAVTAPVRWAEATGGSLASAKHYLADVMDLAHRFPLLHTKVENLRVDTWRALRICADTRPLSFECARWIDATLAERGLYGWRTVEYAIKQGTARFHPDQLGDSARLDRDDWDVRVDHNPNGTPGGGNGTSRLDAVGDSADLAKLVDAVADQAATMGRLGDTDTIGQRKAKALGMLADLQATLDYAGLLDQPDGGSSPGERRFTVNAHGDLVHPVTGKVVHRRRSYGKIRIHVSFTASDLAAFHAGDETVIGDAGTRLGPQTLTAIENWLHRFGPDARITPVIDLNSDWSVDRHDPPDRMRELVQLRDQHCRFPNCTTPAHRCDLDHIEAHDENGPPGQTSPENLAAVCRRHHLMKTHFGWTYVRNKDGTYAWTSPTGRRWLVAPQGTVQIV